MDLHHLIATIGPSRAESVRTQGSVKSTVSKLLRRAKDNFDNTRSDGKYQPSVVSAYSHKTTPLSRSPSFASLVTAQPTNVPEDVQSLSSSHSQRFTMHGPKLYAAKYHKPSRLPEEPPSSFRPVVATKPITNDASLSTTSEIREQINAIEAEKRRILFAIESMEDTAANRRHDIEAMPQVMELSRNGTAHAFSSADLDFAHSLLQVITRTYSKEGLQLVNALMDDWNI